MAPNHRPATGGRRLARRVRKLEHALAAAVLAVLLGACASAIPEVDPQLPPWRGRPADEIETLRLGRREYVGKCSGCHGLYAPSLYPPAAWGSKIEEMADRAHLSPAERGRILAYLQASSGGGLGG